MTSRSRTAWLLVSLLAFGCSGEKSAPVDLARPVDVARVKVVALDERIEATGELVAKDSAEIASEVPGRITDVKVEEGDRVEEGQLLLTIDPEKRELDLANARARVRETKSDLEEKKREVRRVESLKELNVTSAAALDQARTNASLAAARAEAAQAQLGMTERALADSSVRAPFAGMIARRSVSRGEYVQVGQALFEVVALDPVEVEFSIAERDSARVSLGQPVDVQVAPYPDERFRGELSMISPTIDPRTRTLRLKARIANPDGRLRPGLFARADLGVAHREGVLMVPEPAVLQRAEGEVVFIVGAGDLAERKLVKSGSHRDGLVEIAEGLEPGQEVVVRGQTGLVDGTPLARTGAAAPAVAAQERATEEVVK